MTRVISPDQYRAQALERQLADARNQAAKAEAQLSRLVIHSPQTWPGGPVEAGVSVTDNVALSLSAFFACCRLLASTIATLPLHLYEVGPNDVPVPARSVPLYRVLHDTPNADQTAPEFWEFVVLSIIFRGDLFARKSTRSTGETIALEPIPPTRVSVYRRADGSRGYRWSEETRSYDVGEAEVFHVMGFGGGPLRGISILQQARRSLGIAIAADKAAAGMFANGVRPSGVLQAEGWLDQDQRKDLREQLETRFQGAMNAGRPMLLEGGTTWQQVSLNADDAQLLESRAWSVEEICRWFGVPPFMIGHSEKSTSWGTGIEQQMLGFLKFSLMPWLVRIERAISKQLLTPEQRAAGLYAKFAVEGLLRGDSLARARFYETMTRNGIMTRNEARAKEDLPPVEGGDVATIQAQNVPLDEALRSALDERGQD